MAHPFGNRDRYVMRLTPYNRQCAMSAVIGACNGCGKLRKPALVGLRRSSQAGSTVSKLQHLRNGQFV